VKRDKLIEELRVYLLNRRETLRRYLSGELSNLGTDEDYESLDDEIYFVMAATESKELQLIEAAIERHYNKTYGICEDCEKPIPSERLKALPCVCLCIDCQRIAESGSGAPISPNSTTTIGNEFAA